jgi:hypothetical protein
VSWGDGTSDDPLANAIESAERGGPSGWTKLRGNVGAAARAASGDAGMSATSPVMSRGVSRRGSDEIPKKKGWASLRTNFKDVLGDSIAQAEGGEGSRRSRRATGLGRSSVDGPGASTTPRGRSRSRQCSDERLTGPAWVGTYAKKKGVANPLSASSPALDRPRVPRFDLEARKSGASPQRRSVQESNAPSNNALQKTGDLMSARL